MRYACSALPNSVRISSRMSIRLIALDLDGTLVNSRWDISDQDLQALAAASERGIQIVVVTGRRPRAAAPYVARIPFPVTTITSNGALIRTAAGEIKYQNFLPREVALRALETVHAYRPFTVAIFDLPGCGQVTMQDGATPEGPFGWYLRNSVDHLLLVPDLSAAVKCDPVQLMIGGPPARIEGAEPLLRNSGLSVHLTWTRYPDRNIAIFDIMNHDCSKGRALKFWAAQCGMPAEEVMALGDNFNDLEMLEFAGLPVVMGNHIEGLHRPGWAITSACDESGVARAIEQFVLKD
jgi:hydroxymethylpyrimidine pyrophosphatase-like HAD family hydrolase